LTGTLPRTKEGRLLLEGVVGPVIAELKMAAAVKAGLLTPPRVQLISIKKKTEIADIHGYAELYEAAVVKNKIRNLRAVKRALAHIKKGRSVLMIVQKIRHGEEIVESGTKLGLPIIFVNGSTSGKIRSEVIGLFRQKQIRCVVCTDVWREGVDIPSLDVLVNLAGGKSEVRTIQSSGRTMRRAKGKQRAIIVDFLDPYRYLAEHAIQRLQIYLAEGMM
jgi:superfamily II DNA or RNA helicase